MRTPHQAVPAKLAPNRRLDPDPEAQGRRVDRIKRRAALPPENMGAAARGLVHIFEIALQVGHEKITPAERFHGTTERGHGRRHAAADRRIAHENGATAGDRQAGDQRLRGRRARLAQRIGDRPLLLDVGTAAAGADTRTEVGMIKDGEPSKTGFPIVEGNDFRTLITRQQPDGIHGRTPRCRFSP